jgi:SAM-dependent methyltransferase
VAANDGVGTPDSIPAHWLTSAILVEDGEMRGYHDQSYGDGFADVYDDWYADISDVDATTAALVRLADGGRVLELGIGTGRLALPLARAGVEVHGVDSSDAMLARLAAKDDAERLHVVTGDMVDDLPDGPFSLVFVAYNTFFGLLTAERQQECFHQVASRLSPHGCFAIEAFVPEIEGDATSSVSVRSIHADRVVLNVNTADPVHQRAEGHYIDITESGGVKLRPWSIRWATPVQLDGMAHLAHLHLEARWAAFDGAPFGSESTRHVSVYRNQV